MFNKSCALRETVQLVSISYTHVFKEIKLVLMYIDFMELFDFLVDKQSPKVIHHPSLPRLFCNAAVQSSRWWSSEGGWGNKELRSLVTPGKGASPSLVWPSHCWGRSAPPGTLYMLASSQMIGKKNQNELKIPRPNSSLWAALVQRRGKSSHSWTLYPFARIFVWFVQMLPRKVCSTSLGSCAHTVSLEMYQ